MRAWTNGQRHIFLGEDGLHIWDEESTRVITEFSAEAGHRGVLAVSPSGRVIWVRDARGRAVRLDLDDGVEVTPHQWCAHDLQALDDDRVVALYSRGSQAGPLGIGYGRPPVTEDDDWENTLTLAEPERAAWPGLLWEAGEEPWQSGEAFGEGGDGSADEVHVVENFFGTTLSDAATGLIALIPSRAEQIGSVIRVPVAAGAYLHAAATSQGILVVQTLADGDAALVHFDSRGRCLNSRLLWGAGPVAPLDAGRALVLAHEHRDSTELEARVVGLTMMNDQQRHALTFDGQPQERDAFVDNGRRNLIVCGPGSAQIGRGGPAGWSLDADNMIELREHLPEESQAEEPPYVPEWAEGATEINFPVIEEAPESWDYEQGDEVHIPLLFRSSGGAGSGVEVWISGDAVSEGIFEPKTARMGAHEVAFERESDDTFTAVLPGAQLPRGVVYPLDPKPRKGERDYAEQLVEQTHRTLTVNGAAAQEGNALVTVEIAATGQARPIKWIRPFSVE